MQPAPIGGRLAGPGRESHFSHGETEALKGEVLCPVTARKLPLAGLQGTEGPTQPSSPFLPAQFLFLVLRYCDEVSFSSHTSCVCLSGAEPPTTASLPRPFCGLGPWSQQPAEERLPGVPCLSCSLHLEASRMREDVGVTRLLPTLAAASQHLLAQHLVLPRPQDLQPMLCCPPSREVGGENEEGTLRAPCWPVEETRRRRESSRGGLWFQFPGRAGGSLETRVLQRLE